MPYAALLFDLDETLVADQRATRQALRTSCALAEERRGIAAMSLAGTLWDAAERLWLASPHAAYAREVGIASWEALWADFAGEEPTLHALAEWTPGYRRRAWREALETYDVADDTLADALQAAFLVERRALHILFPDALPALERLRGRLRLALLTNGASDLQREKVAGAALGGYFDVVVASGDLGIGKPDPRIYRHTLTLLDVAPTAAAMLGDSLRNDVWGPQQVGMHGIWLRRDREKDRETHDVDPAIHPDAVIRTLDELDDLL